MNFDVVKYGQTWTPEMVRSWHLFTHGSESLEPCELCHSHEAAMREMSGRLFATWDREKVRNILAAQPTED